MATAGVAIAPNAAGGSAAPPEASIAGLSESEFIAAATALGCEVAAIKAVAKTELGIRAPFDFKQRATILFERHVFSRLTYGRFDLTNPDLSNPVPGGYGTYSAQYDKLDRAKQLDSLAAIKSCSWGAFQIMGENYAAAGFTSANSMVAAMNGSVQNQLAAFVAFVKGNSGLSTALRSHNWAAFARRYNGPGYAVNHYDAKMADNYRHFKMIEAKASPPPPLPLPGRP